MKRELLEAANKLVVSLGETKMSIGYIYTDTAMVAKSYTKVDSGGGAVVIGEYDSEVEIQLWFDRILGRDCFWFGFGASTKREVDDLATIWDGSLIVLSDPKFITMKGVAQYKRKLKDQELILPVLESYKKNREFYFGMFSGATASFDVARAVKFISKFLNISAADRRKKAKEIIAIRQGNRRFRGRLLKEYGRQCAITGCSVESVLDAIHIAPYKGPQSNQVSNGMILRTDLHTLFDLNMISIDVVEDDYIVRVGKSARRGYGNLHGAKLNVPPSTANRPSKDLLRDHHRRAIRLDR